MNPPNVTAAWATCLVLQGVAVYKARQAGTWPAPRTELGIASVGLLLMLATRVVPGAKWFGVVIVLGALAGVGTTAMPSAKAATAAGAGAPAPAGAGGQ